MKKILSGFIVGTLCLSSSWVSAEVLKLKNGTIVEGAIVEKTDEYIRLEVSQIPLTYYLEDIDTVVKDLQSLVQKEEAQTRQTIQCSQREEIGIGRGS